jgi:hypothetical protein
MSTTWATVESHLRILLKDEGGDAFSDALLIHAWNAAQDHFTAHTPLQKQASPLTVESSGKEILLPGDFYEIGRLYDSVDNVYWTAMQFQPGGYFDPTNDLKTYAVWGNRLYLYESVSSTNTFVLWYYAYWPAVKYDSTTGEVTEDKIIVPVWAEAPLECLAAAFVLWPEAISAAMQRNYNMRIDSGTPDDNARLQLADALYRWYTILIGAYQPLSRGGH